MTNEWIYKSERTTIGTVCLELNHKCACLRVPVFRNRHNNSHTAQMKDDLSKWFYFGFDYDYIVTVDSHKCHGNVSSHDRFLTLTRSASSLSHIYSYLNSIVSNKWHCLKAKNFEKMEFPLDTKNHRVIIIVFFLCLLMLWDGYISFKVFDRSSDKIIWNLFKPLEKTISKIIIHIVLAEEKKTTKERKP